MQEAQAHKVRWWQALNPPIYLVSVLPGVAVWLLAGTTAPLSIHLVAATVAVILLQHAINVLNDVSDWRLGADVEKYDSWARFHQLNLTLTAVHGYTSLLTGILLGLVVLVVSDKLWIAVIATPLVLLGYLYNSGSRPLSYTHLGEWVTGLCYGPGVFGCLWLLANARPSIEIVPGSLTFFCLAVALLLSHQPAQIATDRQAGKLSFAVRYGPERTRLSVRVLYLIFLLSFATAVWQSGLSTAAIAVCAIGGALSLVRVLQTRPSPRRILAGASLVILATLLADRVAGSLPVA